MRTYTRPELTNEEINKAEQTAKAVLRKYGLGGMLKAVAALCMENRRLVKEINEHRAPLGIEPLEVKEV